MCDLKINLFCDLKIIALMSNEKTKQLYDFIKD
jgi:hypothetical protein